MVPTGFYLIIFDSTRFLASFTPILPSLIGFFLHNFNQILACFAGKGFSRFSLVLVGLDLI